MTCREMTSCINQMLGRSISEDDVERIVRFLNDEVGKKVNAASQTAAWSSSVTSKPGGLWQTQSLSGLTDEVLECAGKLSGFDSTVNRERCLQMAIELKRLSLPTMAG